MSQQSAFTPPAVPHPTGTLRLTLQGSALSVGPTPTVRVGGHPVATRFGTQDVTVWAGRNRVQVASQWMWAYGHATLDVDVAPGQVVPVYYATPWNTADVGSIGVERQRRRGLGRMVAVLAASIVGVIVLVAHLGAVAFALLSVV